MSSAHAPSKHLASHNHLTETLDMRLQLTPGLHGKAQFGGRFITSFVAHWLASLPPARRHHCAACLPVFPLGGSTELLRRAGRRRTGHCRRRCPSTAHRRAEPRQPSKHAFRELETVLSAARRRASRRHCCSRTSAPASRQQKSGVLVSRSLCRVVFGHPLQAGA